MSNLIKQHLGGKKILLLFIITNIIYLMMLFVTIPKVMSYTGGMKIMDMIPMGYSADYVNSLLDTMGEKGRDTYLFYQIPPDMIYPLMFGITYCLIFAFFLKKLNKLDSVTFYLSYLPLLAGMFDYFENLGIITILNSYPDNPDLLSHITNVFSILKSSLTTIYFVCLLILLVVFGINRLYKVKTRI